MKTIVEQLQKHGIVCKKLTPIAPRDLGSRKRISLYVGVDLKHYYCSVMVLRKKSRVLRKEAEELMALHARLMAYADTAITKRYIWVDAPLCSKAKAMMEQEGWVFLQRD
jgi:hypothetical protein